MKRSGGGKERCVMGGGSVEGSEGEWDVARSEGERGDHESFSKLSCLSH